MFGLRPGTRSKKEPGFYFGFISLEKDHIILSGANDEQMIRFNFLDKWEKINDTKHRIPKNISECFAYFYGEFENFSNLFPAFFSEGSDTGAFRILERMMSKCLDLTS